jgi:hypothetical protein
MNNLIWRQIRSTTAWISKEHYYRIKYNNSVYIITQHRKKLPNNIYRTLEYAQQACEKHFLENN